MFLYHGTTSRHIDSVLENGIIPRGDHESVWENFPSRNDMVYLSRAYPFYFAISAAKDDEKAVVFEIEVDKLDEELLHPDEDFIAQCVSGQRGVPLKEIHSEIVENLEGYKSYWEDSINGIGNCCYNGAVETFSLNSMVVFEPEARPHLKMYVMDPSISVINYYFMKEKYNGVVDWFFGHKKEIPNEMFSNLADNDLDEHMKKHQEYWKQESNNRSGIELIEL